MTRTVDDFPQSARINWRDLFDGNVWELTQGEDFICSVRDMQNRISGRARYFGFKVKTRRVGDRVYLQRV